MLESHNFETKVAHYYAVLADNLRYRAQWQKSLRQELVSFLQETSTKAGLHCTVDVRSDIQNMEAVVLSLGSTPSGLGEPVGEGLHRDLIKQNGSLAYQQLFNGKVLVLINYPFIEKYGQPQPPKTIAIYRPDEINNAGMLQHLEAFMTEIIAWEDYDDDRPEPNQRIGFKFNFEQPDGKE